MTFTAISSKGVGDNIARSEVEDLLDNLYWFYRPSTVRVRKVDGTHQVTTTLAAINYLPSGGDWHPEWRYEGGDGSTNDTTYTAGTGGLSLKLGDVAEGIWITGAMTSVRNTNDSSSSTHTRRLLLRRSDGTTPTEIAESVISDDNGARRTGFHLFGLAKFTSSFNEVELMGRVQPSGTDDVIDDRRWALRLGDDTNSAGSVGSNDARHSSDTASELDLVWNRIRANQEKLERRPSGQLNKTGSNQALSAGTEALVTMGAVDWNTDGGMATLTFPNLLIAQRPGWYLVTSQVTFDSYDGGSSHATVSIKKNASSVVASANEAESSHLNTVVRCADIVHLDASDYVSTYALTGAASNVQASRGTQMTLTLLSSTQNVSPDRQIFARCPKPNTWPDVANMSSDHLPVGTLRIISDILDRLWHRPVIKCSLGDNVDISADGTWTDIDLDDADIDYTDLVDTHGIEVFGGGGLRLPWAGVWLVGGRARFQARDVDGVLRGNDGYRGLRLALGDNASAGAIVSPAMNAVGHGWTREFVELVVVNRNAGQDIKLQGLVKSPTADFQAAVVNAANLWAVELGEDVTRDPR